jgi:hypothetical protein
MLVVSSCAFAQTAEPADATSPLAATVSAKDSSVVNGSARIKEYLKKLVSVDAFGEVMPAAAFDHARGFPHEWRRDADGFADRLGSEYAQFVLSDTIQLGISAIHHEDPRYSRLGGGSTLRRTAHALRGAVVASNTRGGETVALGQIAGVYGSWAIATQWWEPKSEQAFSRVMLWGSVDLGVKAGANVVKEFWPDARNKFFGRP